MIRLTDEKMQEIWQKTTDLKALVGSQEEIRENGRRCVRAIRDAQLKKVVECIDGIVEFYACDGACDANYHITDDKKWQALLKEIE